MKKEKKYEIIYNCNCDKPQSGKLSESSSVISLSLLESRILSSEITWLISGLSSGSNSQHSIYLINKSRLEKK